MNRLHLFIVEHESNENVEFQRNQWFMVLNVIALDMGNENEYAIHNCNGALLLIQLMLLILSIYENAATLYLLMGWCSSTIK